MNIAPFATEHFFDEYEFNTPYQLCTSDCESLSISELLEMANVPLSALGELRLGYTEAQGNPALRKAIAAMYQRVSSDQVLVLGTPVEGIYLAARALLEPDDEVIVTTPAYDALVNVFEHVVGPQHVRKWAFQPTEEGWTLDLDELQALINERTRLLVINFPHNPTGFLPTPAQFHELIEIVETHKLWLFADEMYYGLVHAGVAPLPSAADVTPRAIVLSGLSKTYGLPGLRTGWLVIQDEALRADFLNWKFYTSICPPGPSEFLAMAALQVGEQLRAKNLEIIAHNLRTADHFFARWPDLFTWRRPMAGSVALVGMDVPSVSALSAKMAAEAGILIQSAATLGYDDRHMRMGFGRTNMTEALEHFEEYLTQSL